MTDSELSPLWHAEIDLREETINEIVREIATSLQHAREHGAVSAEIGVVTSE